MHRTGEEKSQMLGRPKGCPRRRGLGRLPLRSSCFTAKKRSDPKNVGDELAATAADPGEGLDDALPSFTFKPWTGLEVVDTGKAGIGTRGVTNVVALRPPRNNTRRGLDLCVTTDDLVLFMRND